MNVLGKVALVTGGGRGIGGGIVKALSENGACVAIADINMANVLNVLSDVKSTGNKLIGLEIDVTDQMSVDKAFAEVKKNFGKIDILVNNAGVVGTEGWEGRINAAEDDWDLVYEVNVKGVWRVTQTAASDMKKRKYGKIINISSVAGRSGTQTSLPYGASKASVINITRSLATQLAPFNINVNAICPGLIWTPMWERIAEHWNKIGGENAGLTGREAFELAVKTRIPLGREQTPADVGNLAAFLASDYSKNITGQSINVSGGSHFN